MDLLTTRKIDEFVPKKSIVVTPDKMYTFYANHSIDRETHPIAGKQARPSFLSCRV